MLTTRRDFTTRQNGNARGFAVDAGQEIVEPALDLRLSAARAVYCDRIRERSGIGAQPVKAINHCSLGDIVRHRFDMMEHGR